MCEPFAFTHCVLFWFVKTFNSCKSDLYLQIQLNKVNPIANKIKILQLIAFWNEYQPVFNTVELVLESLSNSIYSFSAPSMTKISNLAARVECSYDLAAQISSECDFILLSCYILQLFYAGSLRDISYSAY